MYLSIIELQYELLFYLYEHHKQEVFNENRLVGLCDNFPDTSPTISHRKIAINRLQNLGYLAREFKNKKFYFNLIPEKFDEIESLVHEVAKQQRANT